MKMDQNANEMGIRNKYKTTKQHQQQVRTTLPHQMFGKSSRCYQSKNQGNISSLCSIQLQPNEIPHLRIINMSHGANLQMIYEVKSTQSYVNLNLCKVIKSCC